jgi:hypothetical protein
MGLDPVTRIFIIIFANALSRAVTEKSGPALLHSPSLLSSG